jgi:aryl-alcohol dehydrogenase-like predicted oxidoreductase
VRASSHAPSVTIGGDLNVGRIGYGAMRLTGPQVWGDYPDRDAAVTLLRRAVDEGVTFIDTADSYGPHSNELLIRDALHPYPDDVVIATKGGVVRGGYDYTTLDAVGNPQYLRQCAHMSARRLGLDHIDLYYLHSPHAKDAGFEDQVGVLAELRQQGVIRHIGLSNVSVDQFISASSIVEISAVTAHYNVVTRKRSGLLSAAEARGAVFSPWRPVSFSDAPAEGPRIRELIAPIAADHAATPEQVALAWLLQQSPAVLPIPGTTSVDHLLQNLRAAALTLTADELATITAMVPE